MAKRFDRGLMAGLVLGALIAASVSISACLSSKSVRNWGARRSGGSS